MRRWSPCSRCSGGFIHGLLACNDRRCYPRVHKARQQESRPKIKAGCKDSVVDREAPHHPKRGSPQGIRNVAACDGRPNGWSADCHCQRTHKNPDEVARAWPVPTIEEPVPANRVSDHCPDGCEGEDPAPGQGAVGTAGSWVERWMRVRGSQVSQLGIGVAWNGLRSASAIAALSVPGPVVGGGVCAATPPGRATQAANMNPGSRVCAVCDFVIIAQLL